MRSAEPREHRELVVVNAVDLQRSCVLSGDDEASITADAIRLRGYLARRQTAPNINGDTPGGNTMPVFSRAQITDSKFFAAHREAIQQALVDGRIVD